MNVSSAAEVTLGLPLLWRWGGRKGKRQSIITLRHEGQSMEKFKELQVSSSAVANPELHMLQRASSLTLPASEITAQINASQNSSNSHLNINCSEETA